MLKQKRLRASISQHINTRIVKMILYSFPSSPFGCKVKAVIFACGQEEQVTIEEFHPWQPDSFFRHLNPLGKIPALKINNDESLFDSPVICEYLMEKAGKIKTLMPDKFKSLKIQALVDGMADAAVSMRYERFFRPQHLQCNDWYDRQYLALKCGLQYLNANLKTNLNNDLLFENLCVATFLSYIDLRFPDVTFSSDYNNLYTWYEQFMNSHLFLDKAKAKDHPIPLNITRLQK